MFKTRLVAPLILSLSVVLAGCGAGAHGPAAGIAGGDFGALAKAKLPQEAKVLKTQIGTIVAGLLPDPKSAKSEDLSPLSVEEQDLLGIGIFAKKKGNLPAKADLRSMFAPVRNQGALGSCSAFAATAVMEAVSGKKSTRLSPLFFYYAERKAMEEDGRARATRKDTGAFMYLAAETAVKVGTTTEKEVPYADGKEGLGYDATEAHFTAATEHKSKKRARVKTLQGMKSALAAKKPILLPIVLYNSFMTRTVARSGEMPMPFRGEEIMGGHAVVAVGYDDEKQAFLIRNSWGTDWGQQGHFWMPYDYFKTSYVGSFYYGECWTLE